MRRQGIFVAANPGGQSSQLEVRLRDRPPRGRICVLAQECAQLAIKIGGRVEQPVSQVLELVLLEQKVLGNAGVKGFDGVDRQFIASLHSGLSSRLSSALDRASTAATATSPTSAASPAAPAPVTPVRCRVNQRTSLRVHGSFQAVTDSSAIHRSISSASLGNSRSDRRGRATLPSCRRPRSPCRAPGRFSAVA